MTKKHNNIQIIRPKKKGDNSVKIVLSEELTIYNIENIKDDIFKAVEKYDYIEMQGTEIKEIDLAFIQLISSIRKTAQNQGKQFTLDIKISAENQELFHNTDITKMIKNIE